MTIYNVLFKGVEVKDFTYCKAFSTFEGAENYAREVANAKHWTEKSSLHGGTAFDEYNNIDDIRFEDEKENTYYAVIYKQDLI